MSMPTSEDPFAGLRRLPLDKEDDIPQHDKTLGDLPPEVMTIILEHLTWNKKRRILGYRLVNSQWNDIICSLLEKKITSGHLPVFPVMRVLCTEWGQDLLHVRYLPKMFPAGQNPFPSNSLVLCGVAGKTNPNFFPAPVVDILWMALPDFMPSFGGNLTTFELQNVVVPGMNSVITILSSMPFLKNLTLKDVRLNDRIIKSKVALPTPPPLSNLKILRVKASREFHRDNPSEKTNVLFVYLIASYADQLVRLNLETHFSLQALQQCHQYSCPLDSSETFPIATTSSSAFANLKILNVAWPTGNFLRNSETPSLQQLSVNGLQLDQEDHITVDLVNFVVKYEANLQQLSLNVYWSELMGIDDGAQLIQATEGVVVPKLKTLAIHYPSCDFQEWMLSERILLMFPALEVLQLLNFTPHELDCSSKNYPARELDEDGNDVKREDGAVDLKEQCRLLRQRIYDIQRNAEEFWARVQAQNGLMEQRQMVADAEEFQSALITARAERGSIFQRLEAIGVKRETVIVEQLLERRGIWKACANLKIVTVSSGGKPDGDICRVRKPNDV